MREVKRSEGGQAFILVMLVLAVVAILGSATLTLTASHRQTAAKQRDRLQAYYAADAGIERALAIIKRNPTDFRSEFPLEGISYAGDGGRIESVTVERIPEGPGTVVKITSVGKFNNARKVIVAKARIYHSESPAELLKGISILPEEQKDIEMTGSFIISGTSESVFYVKGNLKLKGSGQISGFNIYLSGNLDQQESANLSGCTVKEYYHEIPSFPELDLEWYRRRAIEDGQYYSGDGKKNYTKHFSQTYYNGVYFVDGDVEISGTYRGNAVIFATGEIDFAGSVSLNPKTEDDLLVLISQKGVKITGSASVGALIVTGGTLKIGGSALLKGGILARDLDLAGSLVINCNPALVDSHSELIKRAFRGSGGGSTRIEIESWSER